MFCEYLSFIIANLVIVNSSLCIGLGVGTQQECFGCTHINELYGLIHQLANDAFDIFSHPIKIRLLSK